MSKFNLARMEELIGKELSWEEISKEFDSTAAGCRRAYFRLKKKASQKKIRQKPRIVERKPRVKSQFIPYIEDSDTLRQFLKLMTGKSSRDRIDVVKQKISDVLLESMES